MTQPGTSQLDRLTVSRKADRRAIADAIAAPLAGLGVIIERKEREGRRDIDFQFSLNGVGASVWINADLGDGHFLISWYNTEYPSRNFTEAFNCAVGDLLQPRPHHKATSCSHSWVDLRDRLMTGFGAAGQGLAFIEPEVVS